MKELQDKAGEYYAESGFYYRGYYFKAIKTPSLAALNMPEGTEVLKVFRTSDIEFDHDTIIFYTDGPDKKIKVTMRVYKPPGFYVISYVEVNKLNAEQKPLPDIFDSPYGVMYKVSERNKAAEKGFNRLVLNVYQRACDGEQSYKGQPLWVQFHDYSVAICRALTFTRMGTSYQVTYSVELVDFQKEYEVSPMIKHWVDNEDVPTPWLVKEPVPETRVANTNETKRPGAWLVEAITKRFSEWRAR